MDKDKKIFLGILLLLLFFMFFVGILAFQDKDRKEEKEVIKPSETLIFKEEYEKLNNKENDSGKTYKNLVIAEDSKIDILTEDETVKFLEEGTGILYLGFPECPWCRSMLPVLLTTLKNEDNKKLYYFNIFNSRDSFKIDEKGKLEKDKDGTENYYKMLEIMDEVLEPYYVKNEKGKKINTKEKRILAPTIVGINKGKIVGIHVSTVNSHLDPYEELDEKQQKELTDIYNDLIKKVYSSNTCEEAC